MKEERYLTVKLHEGMGNQLFQLAAGLGISMKLGRRFIVNPNRMFHSHSSITDRAIRWIIDDQFMVGEEEEKDKSFVLQGHSKHYMDIKDSGARLMVLDGYWQHIGYFSNCLDLLPQKFAILSAGSVEVDRIGLHLRLGDYCRMKHRFHLVSSNYIRKAVLFQLKRGASPRVDVYTDRKSADVAHTVVQEALKGMGLDIHVVREGNDCDDFVRLSSYNHLIGGPSTFSWWASFLHRNVSPVHYVCFPKQFYNPHCSLSGEEEGFYDATTLGELFIIDDAS